MTSDPGNFRRTPTRWKVLLVGLFLVIGVLAVALTYDHAPNPLPLSVLERLEQSCRREFGDRGELAVFECHRRLFLEEIAREERDRSNRTRRP